MMYTNHITIFKELSIYIKVKLNKKLTIFN